MRRYPTIDPPEYLDWRAEPPLLAEYVEQLAENDERRRLIAALDETALLRLYRGMLRFRLHDYTLKRWVRQGVISKAWLGTGEEAVTVGAVHALESGRDYVAPMIRNQGALHELGMTLESLFAGYLGAAASPSGGRDGHIGDLKRGVIAPISHVGDMVPVTTGVALAFRLQGESRVALTWIGDGTVNTGAAHEGLNLAAVLEVPAIFIVQNNRVALGTRVEQHRAGDLHTMGAAYGIESVTVDGNNVLAVYGAVRHAADRARAGGGPFLIVADTFRMAGHATHDEADARRILPAELFAHWGARDPIGLFEEYLVAQGTSRAKLEESEQAVAEEVASAAERALTAHRESPPSPESAEYQGVSAGQRQPGLARRLAAKPPATIPPVRPAPETAPGSGA